MISAGQWEAYNKAVESIRAKASTSVEQEVLKWCAENPSATVAEARTATARILSGYAKTYDQAGAALAAEWYDAQVKRAGIKLDRAVTVVTYTNHDVDKLVHYQVEKFKNGDIPGFAAMCGEYAANDAMKSVNKTILKNVSRDKNKGVKFARVTSGRNTCAFCLMLAGRGAVYDSRKSAGEFDHWHRHCTCKVVPCLSGNQYEVLVEGHDPKKIENRLLEIERLTGTKRNTPEFTREVALRDPNWLFGDVISYDVALGASPDDVESRLADLLCSAGIKAEFQPRSVEHKARRADVLINDDKWEFKNPTGNSKMTVFNQFKSVVFGENKHERNPQAGKLVLSNVRSDLEYEEMCSNAQAVLKAGEFPEITDVLVVGKDGRARLLQK